jgi:hypothetical protein
MVVVMCEVSIAVLAQAGFTASQSCALKKEILIGAAKPILKPVAYERDWQAAPRIFLHLLILQREGSTLSVGLSVTPDPEMGKIFLGLWSHFLQSGRVHLRNAPRSRKGGKSDISASR